MHLDFLGIPHNIEITAGFGVAPFPLRAIRLITLVHERLALRIRDAAEIRLLEPPVPRLQAITGIMAWTNRTDAVPAHRWLRGTLIDLAAEYDNSTTPPRRPDRTIPRS